MNSKQGVVVHNVCALRAEPRSGAEQTSELIMGDSVRILEMRDGYAHVCGADDYTGWALARNIRVRQDNDKGNDKDSGKDNDKHNADPNLQRSVTAAFADVVGPDSVTLLTRLVFATPVSIQPAGDANSQQASVLVPVTLPDGTDGSVQAKDLEPLDASLATADRICLYARRFMGSPYVWGGTTPFGIDCSGLVQRVYGAVGITLPRDAYLMASCPHGREVSAEDKRRAGDLVFFRGPHDPRSRGITHVGLMLDDSTMIHAYGRTGVTLNRLDDAEIRTEYTVKAVRRFIP